METLLLTVTGVSLLVVLVLAAVLARILHDERQRSAARVAALVAMSAPSDDVAPAVGTAPRAPDAADLDLRPAVGHAGLFAQRERSSAWGRRLAIMTPLAILVLGAGIAFYPSRPEIAATAPAIDAPSAAPAPLELLSLTHAHEGETLTVTGLVQNPRAAAPVSKVFATAFVFAADGSFLASGRAPLDFTTLAPGDESPFVVTVPVTGAVARYRIGFRREDGGVVAHVDRRAGGAIARVSEERP